MNPFVTLSPRADEELELILAYLDNSFGINSAIKCIDNVEVICWQIAAFPFAFPAYKGNAIRKAVVSRNLSMFYQVKEDTIELLSFWDNRMNPENSNI